MDRNLWATEAFNWDFTNPNVESYWYYYQWWNNHGFSRKDWSTEFNETVSNVLVTNTTEYWPNTDRWYYDSPVFVESSFSNWWYLVWYSWANPLNKNLWWWWGDLVTNNRDSWNNREDRRWPCPEWYHIPSAWERSNLFKFWCLNTNECEEQFIWEDPHPDLKRLTNMSLWKNDAEVIFDKSYYEYFKLPFAWIWENWWWRNWVWLIDFWNYRSSTAAAIFWNVKIAWVSYELQKTNLRPFPAWTKYAESIRCFKDEYYPIYTVKFFSSWWTNIPDQIIDPNTKNKAIKPQNPVRKNSTFVWWFEEWSDIEFNFNSEITRSVKLYAKWTCLNESFNYWIACLSESDWPFTITFDSNWWNSISNQIVQVWYVTEQPDDPTYSNHNLIWWYLEWQNNPFEFWNLLSDNITLKAKWGCPDWLNDNWEECTLSVSCDSWAVAKIWNKCYLSINDAVEEAVNWDTIDLIDWWNIYHSFDVDKKITINMNWYSFVPEFNMWPNDYDWGYIIWVKRWWDLTINWWKVWNIQATSSYWDYGPDTAIMLLLDEWIEWEPAKLTINAWFKPDALYDSDEFKDFRIEWSRYSITSTWTNWNAIVNLNWWYYYAWWKEKATLFFPAWADVVINDGFFRWVNNIIEMTKWNLEINNGTFEVSKTFFWVKEDENWNYTTEWASIAILPNSNDAEINVEINWWIFRWLNSISSSRYPESYTLSIANPKNFENFTENVNVSINSWTFAWSIDSVILWFIRWWAFTYDPMWKWHLNPWYTTAKVTWFYTWDNTWIYEQWSWDWWIVKTLETAVSDPNNTSLVNITEDTEVTVWEWWWETNVEIISSNDWDVNTDGMSWNILWAVEIGYSENWENKNATFSRPIAVRIPFWWTWPNWKDFMIKVRHTLEKDFWYEWLTLTPWIACNSDGTVPEEYQYKWEKLEPVLGNDWKYYVYIYSCAASTFVAYTDISSSSNTWWWGWWWGWGDEVEVVDDEVEVDE